MNKGVNPLGYANRQTAPAPHNPSPSKNTLYRPPSLKIDSNQFNTVQHPTKQKSYALQQKQQDLPVNSPMAKLTALARRQYLNPLARLDYEDREMEVFTKITKQSQKTVQKKLKARNQLADFQDDQFDEEREIDDLIQFKFGRTNVPTQRTQIYFEKEPETYPNQPAIEISQYEMKPSSSIQNLQQQSPRLKPSELQPLVQKSNYFKQQAPPTPIVLQQPRIQSPLPIPISPSTPPKQLYCNSCQSFMSEQQAQLHCKDCFFDYSQNWTLRKQQIISKLQKIYQNFCLLPATPNTEGLQKILVEITYVDDSRRAEEALKMVRGFTRLTEMEGLLQRRVMVCLEEKVALRSHIGPRLNIFNKNREATN